MANFNYGGMVDPSGFITRSGTGGALGNVAPAEGFGSEYASTPGPRENFMDQLFQTLLGNAPAGTPQMANIQKILSGTPAIADEAIRAQKKFAKQQFRRDQAASTESFGKMGARFGTDLADTLGRNAQDFRQGLYAQEMALRTQLAENAKTRSLQALQAILGTGQFSTGLEFARGEGAAGRAIEELLQKLRNEGALDVAGLQAESGLDASLLELLANLGG